LSDAPTTIASARLSLAIRLISVNGSPWAAMKVTDRPSSRATSSARPSSCLAISSCASLSAASTLGPAGLASASDAIGAT